jgi:hypothetical protein
MRRWKSRASGRVGRPCAIVMAATGAERRSTHWTMPEQSKR